MSKLALIYNFAPRYRKGIFCLIDKEYDCHWYFGNNDTDIKGLDWSVLKEATLLENKTFIHSPLYWQKGMMPLLWDKDYSTYFMLGEPYNVSTWVFALLRKLFFRRKRIYFWSHGWYGKEGRIKTIVKKAFFHLADGTFLYGNYAKTLMVKEGFREDELFVIHNSLDYDKQLPIRESLSLSGIFREHFGNDCPVLIFIGRLTAVKRIDLLIDALVKINQEGRGCNLVLVGDGVERPALEELVQERKVEDKVWFYDACYDEKTNAELIYNADLCVSPGNVGLTAMHAMMFGTPVITHNRFKYQMPEFEAVKPGETGDFFEYDDVESLAACISGWLDNHKSGREEVRKSCYNEIDSFWTPEYQMNVLKEHLEL